MCPSVRPELLTFVGSSASLQTCPSPLIYRGLTVQTNRATSFRYERDQVTTLDLDFLGGLNLKSLSARPEQFTSMLISVLWIAIS